jgi:hypothetical protein
MVAQPAIGQGAETMSLNLDWRLASLSVVFLTDAIVFARLCREELRDWQAQRGASPGGAFGLPGVMPSQTRS